MKINSIFLTLILLSALMLRFYLLADNPPSLTWDEVAWGYNAYSLGIDGRDEFGRFLPVDYLESFGDFKPPVYAYLALIPVKVFGLNEFAVRFPSTLLGTVTVLVTYFLVKEIFSGRGKGRSGTPHYAEYIALISAGILAISPWHIMLSRAAFEANTATFFLVTAVWLFLKAMRHSAWLLILSGISFVVSFYTFNTARVVAPILAGGLALGHHSILRRHLKQTLIAALVGLLLLLPVVPFMLTPQAGLRFREVNIFTDINVIKQSNRQIENDHNAWWSKIIHNRRLAYGVLFVKHYLDNLTPEFLFIKGDGNPKFSVQTVGQLYLWELPFLVIGAFWLFKKREGSWWIIPFWLIIGIIPAATARETPHALRIEAVLPTFQILVAYGFINTLALFKYKKVFVLGTGMLVMCNLAYFLHGYYVHYPIEYSREWQFGYRESIAYVKQVESSYDRIYITTDMGRPYIYYLFYTQTRPQLFRSSATVNRDAFGFVDVRSFGKYVFTDALPESTPAGKKYLYVDMAENVPANASVFKTIHLLNGEPVLRVYTL